MPWVVAKVARLLCGTTEVEEGTSREAMKSALNEIKLGFSSTDPSQLMLARLRLSVWCSRKEFCQEEAFSTLEEDLNSKKGASARLNKIKRRFNELYKPAWKYLNTEDLMAFLPMVDLNGDSSKFCIEREYLSLNSAGDLIEVLTSLIFDWWVSEKKKGECEANIKCTALDASNSLTFTFTPPLFSEASAGRTDGTSGGIAGLVDSLTAYVNTGQTIGTSYGSVAGILLHLWNTNHTNDIYLNYNDEKKQAVIDWRKEENDSPIFSITIGNNMIKLKVSELTNI